MVKTLGSRAGSSKELWVRLNPGREGSADVHALQGCDGIDGLLGQDRADEPDDGLVGREDPDGVGASTDLAVQPLQRYLEPELGQTA